MRLNGRDFRAIRSEQRWRDMAIYGWECVAARLLSPRRSAGLTRLMWFRPSPDRSTLPTLHATLARVGPYEHCEYMTSHVDSTLRSMEWSYLGGGTPVEMDPGDLIGVLDGILDHPSNSPFWRPYAVAVRTLAICAVSSGIHPVYYPILIGHLRTHAMQLTMRSERHLRNNHRSTIEFARLVATVVLGRSQRTLRRRVEHFATVIQNQVGQDGFSKERSSTYSALLRSEARAAVDLLRGMSMIDKSTIHDLAGLDAALSEALDARVLTNHHYPAFGDTFDSSAPVDGEPHPSRRDFSVWSDESCVVFRAGPYDLAISLGSVGPPGFGGHGHGDAGSLELCHAERGLVIADPGCSAYEASIRRSWERSFLAHNMLTPSWTLRAQPFVGAFDLHRPVMSCRIDELVDEEPEFSIRLVVEHHSARTGASAAMQRICRLHAERGLLVVDRVLRHTDPTVLFVRSFFYATEDVRVVEARGTNSNDRLWSPVRRPGPRSWSTRRTRTTAGSDCPIRFVCGLD